MLRGTNLKYTKAYNYRIVLETIRLHGPFSRADVARHTSLTAQTVSNIVRELIDADLVIKAGRRQEGRGAPATTLTINPDSAFSIGLDFDRDHLTGVLMDFSGAVRQRVHYDLDFPKADEALDLMTETVEAIIAKHEAPRDTIVGVGIGFPGPLNISDGNVAQSLVNPKKYPGWENVPVANTLQQRLSLPVILENNATAAAVGERWYGAGQKINTFFYMYFGSGLGGGIILNGYPFDGHSGNAGELGYLPIQNGTDHAPAAPPAPQQPLTHVGERFHLPSLYQTLQNQGVEASTPADLEAIYADAPPALSAWIDTAGDHLATLTLAVEYLIDPEAIFFGGRLPEAIIGDLLNQLQDTLPQLRLAGKLTTPRLMKATAGIDAAALGVATLPLYEFFSPVPQLLLKRDRDGDAISSASLSAMLGIGS